MVPARPGGAYAGPMSENSGRHDPFVDVVNILAAPIAGGLRAVDQVRRGSDELLTAIENLNITLQNLNETTQRVNALLSEFEEPVRAMMPQLMRTIRTADELTQWVEGPIRAAAPNIGAAVQNLSQPGLASLPAQFGEFLGVLQDMSARLGPLVQLADNAGGLFGMLKIPGMGARPTTPRTPEADAQPTAAKPSTAEQPVAKKSAAKQPAAKKPVAKKPVAKKQPKKG